MAKWENEFDFNIDWNYGFLHSYETRWFQFIVLDRILTTSSYMYKINISDSNSCIFCRSTTQMLNHLFGTVIL